MKEPACFDQFIQAVRAATKHTKRLEWVRRLRKTSDWAKVEGVLFAYRSAYQKRLKRKGEYRALAHVYKVLRDLDELPAPAPEDLAASWMRGEELALLREAATAYADCVLVCDMHIKRITKNDSRFALDLWDTLFEGCKVPNAE